MDPSVSLRGPLTEAKGIADAMPEILIEARRVASTVLAGWHGRRTSGRGETFWQFRPFTTGEAAAAIDWRRSARDEHLFVREKEWEAAHTMWLWADLSQSMNFRSRLAPTTKRTRATVLLLALAEMLSVAGERIGLLGASDPILARNGAERVAVLIPRAAETAAPPDARALRRFSDIVLFGDFLDPIDEIEKTLNTILRTGARAHLVQITDPIEETFPFAGRTEFVDPESGARYVVSRAEQYRDEYHNRLAGLRDHLRTLCGRLDWTFLVHRTDQSATQPLLALHARLADRTHSLGLHASGRAA
jgi:uncharacterized protein (DUF58 family)